MIIESFRAKVKSKYNRFKAWLVECLLKDLEVVGSNPSESQFVYNLKMVQYWYWIIHSSLPPQIDRYYYQPTAQADTWHLLHTQNKAPPSNTSTHHTLASTAHHPPMHPLQHIWTKSNPQLLCPKGALFRGSLLLKKKKFSLDLPCLRFIKKKNYKKELKTKWIIKVLLHWSWKGLLHSSI